MTITTSWQDKAVIVTGGSSGIGKATALALASHGANVLITGRNTDKLSATAAEHPAIVPLQSDSAHADSSAQIVKRALDTWGRLDLIVNNSGAGQPMPMDSYDADTIANMSAVNITAPSLMIQAGASALKESKGAIVNIGTATSNMAVPMIAHYAATKAALDHLTKSWALELATDGVRVNAISPGPVETGALRGMMGLPDEVAKQIEAQEAAQIPLGRRGFTSDIVPWVLMLGSSENVWTTGQIVTVDGGWTLRS